DQLHVVAREKIAVDGLAEAENSNGMLPDAARNEVIQVQLLERAAHGVGDISRRTGGLKKERPTDKLGPGRIEETQVHGPGKTHTHGARETHAARLLRVVHENGQAVYQQGLREAVHYGAEHGIKPHFVRQRAAKFDQRAAVIEAVAVEEAVQAGLNPFAEGLKQKCGDDNGDHASHRPGGRRVEEISNQRHQREVDGGYRRSSGGVGQAALEDDVHVHQAVTNDGVGETKRNEHQTND